VVAVDAFCNRSVLLRCLRVRLHIFSDIHAEFAEFEPPNVDADVVVIPGDLHVGREGRKWIRRYIPEKPVIYVLGNHEFYRHVFPNLIDELRRETAGSNIHLLENQAVEINGFSFLGCTLWSDFRITGDEIIAKAIAHRGISDYELITKGARRLPLLPDDTANAHHASLAWLKQQTAGRDTTKTVIVTHHAPSRKSIPPWHVGSLLNGAFVSDLEDFIAEAKAPLWIHGHTHYCVDYKVASTRVVSNQRGYPGAISPAFDPGLVLEI
jgi:Icc-related predicted phosphoesterase